MIKAYKGFNKDMTCLGYKFVEGEEYEHDGEVKVCEGGFHACERPLDCFEYYPPAESVYHVVELEGSISKSDDDTKVAAEKIKIGARIDIAGLAQAQFAYVEEHVTTKSTDSKIVSVGDYGAASAGSHGAASAGSHGAASAGSHGAASAGYCGAAGVGDCGAAGVGDYGVANAGDCGAASVGDYGVANAGDYGAANAGEYGAANAGHRGVANAGDYGAAISRGSASVGTGGIVIARGDERIKNKVRGGVGAIIVIAVECRTSADIIAWKAAMVDGEKIKAETWYCLKDGEFVEAE